MVKISFPIQESKWVLWRRGISPPSLTNFPFTTSSAARKARVSNVQLRRVNKRSRAISPCSKVAKQWTNLFRQSHQHRQSHPQTIPPNLLLETTMREWETGTARVKTERVQICVLIWIRDRNRIRRNAYHQYSALQTFPRNDQVQSPPTAAQHHPD